MRTIWYFVGLLLVITGVLVLAGEFVRDPAATTVLGHTRPNLWWGGIMVIAGALFVVTNWNARVE